MTNLPYSRPPHHLTRAKIVCKAGTQFYGNNSSHFDVQCKADILTPKWETVTGAELPSCVKACSNDKDCGEKHVCNKKLRQCRESSCPSHLDMNYGQIVNNSDLISEHSIRRYSCQQNYILDPTDLSGEGLRSIPIKCVRNSIDETLDWRLLNSQEIPQCVPGLHLRSTNYMHFSL